FLKALEDSGAHLANDYPSLETILTTGSPLLPEQFDFVYGKIKGEVQLSSISGGTDIASCFVLGNPVLPVYRGEIQCIGLGMDVTCYSEDGRELINTKGELACKKSFPSRPTHFLNDPAGDKINKAYFNTIPDIWCHGDFVTITDRKTIIIHGRSDTTLNPGGVRIGTAEIYRQIEVFDFIDDSLCVGQQIDGDVKVILFVKLKEDEQLDDHRIKTIKNAILNNTTPRHVPANINQVKDIPYTRSGKKMELPVTRLLSNMKIDNIEAVANPECLAEYEQYQQA
ncbi:MAG: acetoacetate--CoA ligase, partial [Proteobacteria bacterium]|nr:acetoacetate--CoA ligase [Pseudomonadota bacterium]